MNSNYRPVQRTWSSPARWRISFRFSWLCQGRCWSICPSVARQRCIDSQPLKSTSLRGKSAFAIPSTSEASPNRKPSEKRTRHTSQESNHQLGLKEERTKFFFKIRNFLFYLLRDFQVWESKTHFSTQFEKCMAKSLKMTPKLSHQISIFCIFCTNLRLKKNNMVDVKIEMWQFRWFSNTVKKY